MNQEDKTCAKACETCPFRKKYQKSFSLNQDRKNAADLRKVWEHFRTGNIGLCIESKTDQHVCNGAAFVVQSHVNHINKIGIDKMIPYVSDPAGVNLSLQGYLFWHKQPEAVVDPEGLGLPWNDPIVEAAILKFKDENK